MFKRLGLVWQHSKVIIQALLHSPQRSTLRRMFAFSQTLPRQFNQPLPQMMAELTPTPQPGSTLPPDNIRRLADVVAVWHIRSPLGICLRRSLLRYCFLRETGVDVSIVFGARFKGQQEGGGIGGHAWLTLDGAPYYENPQDYEGFVEMYVYPADGRPL